MLKYITFVGQDKVSPMRYNQSGERERERKGERGRGGERERSGPDRPGTRSTRAWDCLRISSYLCCGRTPMAIRLRSISNFQEMYSFYSPVHISDCVGGQIGYVAASYARGPEFKSGADKLNSVFLGEEWLAILFNSWRCCRRSKQRTTYTRVPMYLSQNVWHFWGFETLIEIRTKPLSSFVTITPFAR